MHYNKNYFNLTKIFLFRLFKIEENHSAQDLNIGLLSNFGWLKSVNHVKCIEEYVMHMEKHVLVKKNVYKWVKYAFVTMSWKNSPLRWTHRLSSKEKVLDAVVSEEGNVDSLQRNERINNYWFPWKKCNCKQCFLLPTP